MRGDSLRDLYAKALALLGLGMLAGTGALMDHWPVAGLPTADSVRVRPKLLQRPDSGAVGVSEAPFAVAMPLPAPATSRWAVPHTRRDAVPSGSLLRPTPVVSAVADPVEPQPLSVTTVARIMVGTSLSGLPLPPPTEVLVSLEQSFETEEYPRPRTVLASGSSDATGDGLITGAFKKTGSSLVRTGARTGASIFDAVRVVSGVVRRALPPH